jgi:hypothetical protein
MGSGKKIAPQKSHKHSTPIRHRRFEERRRCRETAKYGQHFIRWSRIGSRASQGGYISKDVSHNPASTSNLTPNQLSPLFFRGRRFADEPIECQVSDEVATDIREQCIPCDSWQMMSMSRSDVNSIETRIWLL